jgi:hypothetical protein
VRLVDVIVRRGHLSEQALLAALLAGDRPAHLERCDVCASRAVDLARWMDQLGEAGPGLADLVFTPERRQLQKAQILRRLEQLETPTTRVITFPSASPRPGAPDAHVRRVAPGWLAVAAAAGVLLGAAGAQLALPPTDLVAPRPAAAAPTGPQPADAGPIPAAAPAAPGIDLDAAFLYGTRDFSRSTVRTLQAYDELTPRSADVVLAIRP